MSMNAFQEACQLNNAGAAYLASNDASNAFKALKSALVIMEEISRDDDVCDDLMVVSVNEKDQQPSLEVPGLEDIFFIYNRALLLDSQKVDLAFANAVILFNLALTFHQRGKVCCQEAKLRRAAHLYELSVKLIPEVTYNSGALLVAAFNNQAQIFNELWNFAQAGEALEQLQNVSALIPSPEEYPTAEATASNHAVCAFSRDIFDEIYLNLMTISQPPTTAPTA